MLPWEAGASGNFWRADFQLSLWQDHNRKIQVLELEEVGDHGGRFHLNMANGRRSTCSDFRRPSIRAKRVTRWEKPQGSSQMIRFRSIPRSLPSSGDPWYILAAFHSAHLNDLAWFWYIERPGVQQWIALVITTNNDNNAGFLSEGLWMYEAQRCSMGAAMQQSSELTLPSGTCVHKAKLFHLNPFCFSYSVPYP